MMGAVSSLSEPSGLMNTTSMIVVTSEMSMWFSNVLSRLRSFCLIMHFGALRSAPASSRWLHSPASRVFGSSELQASAIDDALL